MISKIFKLVAKIIVLSLLGIYFVSAFIMAAFLTWRVTKGSFTKSLDAIMS